MTRLTLALMLLVANMPMVLAQHGGTSQEQRACTRDAQRFCRQYLGNDNEVQVCLEQNRSRLSSSCKRVFESHGM